MDDVWELIKRGDILAALAMIDAGLKEAPDSASLHMNRGLCLLIRRMLPEALLEYQFVCEHEPIGEKQNKMAGVILWWLGRHDEALIHWERALSAPYTDAAGGVIIPAILLFAADLLARNDLGKEARRLLQKRWRSKRAQTWPGPIAGYLLGHIESSQLIDAYIANHPILEARRRTQVYFWIAYGHYKEGNLQEYKLYLQRAIENETTEHRAVIIETEYWLATAELDRLASRE